MAAAEGEPVAPEGAGKGDDLAQEEDQDRILNDMRDAVKKESSQMMQAIDHGELTGALRHANNMLRDLQAGLLSPKHYYDLYMAVFDELRNMETFFAELHRKGTKMTDLYELVQHAGNVLPRLYLLITVASVYLQAKEVPCRDILRDLVEMVKGVQHPMRGLFLRNYLSTLTKDKLPDTGSEYCGEGGDVHDAIDFVLQNFGEMNRLWVRMQRQGPARSRKRRELERRDLQLLVGTSLVRLSQLEGVDLELYKKEVLPRILEVVTNCKDKLAQSYLMECIIQVFPDDFHLHTLEPLLTTCTELQPDVDVNSILAALMTRLAKFVSAADGVIPAEIKAFQIVNEYVAKVVDARPSMEVADILQLQVSLLEFAISCYPGRLDYVDHVLGFVVQLMTRVEDRANPNIVRLLVRLLTVPLDSLALEILNLGHFPEVMAFLPFDSRKAVAVKLLRSVLAAHAEITSQEQVAQLLTVLSPLVRDEEGQPPEEEERKESFEDEQRLVAKLVHLMTNASTDNLFRMYGTARKFFGHGGTRRITHTLVPLVFASLKLTAAVFKKETAGEQLQFSARKVFQFVHEICTALASSHAEVSLRLFLQSALAADACAFEAISYEFFAQAFILYEDQIVESKAQFAILTLVIGTLQRCRNYDLATGGNYDNLITRATQYSAKLLKKPDQCRLVCLCSHLFWRGREQPRQNSQRLLECLQRSLKIADMCLPASAELFVEILNRYMFFFEHDCETITVAYLSGLIALINEHLETMDPSDAKAALEAHYHNTLAHIRVARAAGREGYKEVAAGP